MSATRAGLSQLKNVRTRALGTAVDSTGGQPQAMTVDRSSRAIAQARVLGDVSARTGPRPAVSVPLGPMLAEARQAAGLSAPGLAALIGAAPSTVRRIERSERRVSPAMLASLAAALSPDDPEPLRTALTSAAGPLLVADTPGGVRRRERRMRRARRERDRRVMADFRRREAVQRRAGELAAAAYRMFDQPGALDDSQALASMCALLDESHRLQDEAGPHIVGTTRDQLFVTQAKILGKTATMARTGRLPATRKRQTPSPRPLEEPPRDAPWPVVDRYLREKARRELGVEY